MAATYTAEHLKSRSERRIVEYDSDGALNIVDLGRPQGASNKCLPIANFKRFLAGYMTTVGTGGITQFDMIAATDAAGSGATQIVAHALGTNPDAVGDHVWLECDVAQVLEVLPTATHIGLRVDMVTATDECVFYFERAEPYYPVTGLTADYIA